MLSTYFKYASKIVIFIQIQMVKQTYQLNVLILTQFHALYHCRSREIAIKISFIDFFLFKL